MKGVIYDEQFIDITKLSELGESQSRRIQQYANRDTQTECQFNRSRIDENIQRRDERNKKRYKETTISDKFRNEKSQRNDINRNEAEYNRKIVAWHNDGNPRTWHTSRIFNQFLDIQRENDGLSNRNQHTTSEHTRARQVENSSELTIQREWITVPNSSKIDTRINGQNKNISDIQWGAIVDDTIRESFIRRSKAIADGNSEITRRNKEQAEREQKAKRELREFATEQNNLALCRLNNQIKTRFGEHISKTQKQIRELRRRTTEHRSYQDRIKDDQEHITRELEGYADRVSDSIQRTKSAAIERNIEEFRECLEREIERELKKPEHQRLLEVKRQREKELSRSVMRMR